MTTSNRETVSGRLSCPDGQTVTPDICRFCLHSRYFIINGKEERSPALAFCLKERVTGTPDTAKASAVGCAAGPGCGYTNIGNIIS